MKAKTISAIREMLKENKDRAYRDYKALKEKLEQKYDTDWLENTLNDYEKKAYYDLREECYEAEDIFEDFENHQW